MADAPTLTLIVGKGPRKGESIECKRGRVFRIGRVVRGNTFAIKDPGISERHISVQHLPDHSWSLTDLDTSNGTFLNDRQIDPLVPTSLRDGDLIKIGAQTSMRVQIVEVEVKEVAERGRRRGRPRKLEVAEEASNVRRTRGAAGREAAEALKVEALEGDKGASGEEEGREVLSEKASKSKGGASTGRKGRGASRRRRPALGSVEEELEEDSRGVARREAAEALKVDALEGDKGGSGEEKERAVATEKVSKGGASTGRKGRGASRKWSLALGPLEEELEEDMRLAARREAMEVLKVEALEGDKGGSGEEKEGEVGLEKVSKGGAPKGRKGRGASRRRRPALGCVEEELEEDTRGVARREATEVSKVEALDGDKGGSGEEKERAVVTDKASTGGASMGRKGRGASRRRPLALGPVEEELEEDMRLAARREATEVLKVEALGGDKGGSGEEKEGEVLSEKASKGGASTGRKGQGASRRRPLALGPMEVELEEDRKSGEQCVRRVEQEKCSDAEGVVGEGRGGGLEECAFDKEVPSVGCVGVGRTADEHGGVMAEEEEEDIDMEKMTLGQWFDQLEKCLPMMISDAAEEIIAEIRAKADQYNKYLSGRCGAV